MTRDDFLDRISVSGSLAELLREGILPEPYDDTGFYLVYYAEEDYKHALPEIVHFIDSGLRIYYDRFLESGEAHTEDFVNRALSSHCRSVVFYLSECALDDPTLRALTRVVAENRIPAVSICRSEQGDEISGAAMAKRSGADAELCDLFERVFPDEVTFIPYSLPTAEKMKELKRAYESNAMHFVIQDGYAVAEYAKDLSVEEITIPASVQIGADEYPVRAVASRAFSGCRGLRTVHFPDSVEDIGYGAFNVSAAAVFDNCELLEEVIYPPRVKKIYGGMFSGCHSLRRLCFNGSAVFVGDPGSHFDFRSARGIDLADVDATESSEGEGPTDGHPLEELRLPDSATVIQRTEDEVMFCYDTSDTCAVTVLAAKRVEGGRRQHVERNHTVTRLSDYYLFNGNTEVETVRFPRDYDYAEKWIRVFKGCTSLREVNLPDSVLELEQTFEDCTALESVRLPDSLAAIESRSFARCTSLRTVTLPRYLYSVADTAFSGVKIDTVISDSIYSKNIFKSGYREDSLVFSVGQSRFMRKAASLLFRLIFGLSEKNDRPFMWWGKVRQIYITAAVKPFEIEGYEECQSDRPGYRRYLCRISEIERLSFMRRSIGKR